MGNIIIGAVLLLIVVLIVRSLVKRYGEGKPVSCGDCSQQDACPYMKMSEEELLEMIKKRENESK